MSSVHYATVREGRAHLADLMDAAADGRPATVRRNHDRAALVDADRLRRHLSKLTPARAMVTAEGGGWSVIISGQSIAADGATLADAVDGAVEALREYAADWSDHLRHAPNHRENWALVQIIELSTDAQLKAWLDIPS